MRALRDLQQAFGAAMLSDGEGAVWADIVEEGFTAAERLRIYRNTFHSTLIAALRMSYPAVDRLIGAECFDLVAEGFIHAHPPGGGYLNEYGGRFSDFLATVDSLRTLRYLPDVARFEWALSVAANAPDTPALNAAALAAINSEHHASLCFEPHPSLSLLTLAYPADHIADAVLSGDDTAMAAVDLSSGPVRLIVHRSSGGIEARRLKSEVYDFIARLCAGETLATLLESAPADAAMLLAEQLTEGRLSAFRIDTTGRREQQ